DASPTTLPQWRPFSAGETSTSQIFDLPIPEEVSNGVKQTARDCNVPLKSALLAAHLRVMALVSGNADVLTGVVSHGRLEEIDGERTLGLFLNTLPFRLSLTGGSWKELLQQTFAAEREALPFRRFPLAELLKSEPRNARLETGFNFNHFKVYEQLRVQGGVEVLGSRIFEQTNFTLGAIFSLDVATAQIHLQLNY